MVSAFVGNVVEWGQPWSQIAPSVVGLIVVVYFVHTGFTGPLSDRAAVATHLR
jgi:hypothetical protein